MTGFPFSIGFFARFRRVRALRWMLVAAALAAVVAMPDSADAARRVAGPYDGVWTTVFATTRRVQRTKLVFGSPGGSALRSN